MVTLKHIRQYLEEQICYQNFNSAQSLLDEIIRIMKYNCILDDANLIPCNEGELVKMTAAPSIYEVYDGDMIHFNLCGYRVTLLECYHDAGSNLVAFIFEVYDGKRTYSSLSK